MLVRTAFLRRLLATLGIMAGWLLTVFFSIIIASAGLGVLRATARGGDLLDFTRVIELPGLMRLPTWALAPVGLGLALVAVLTVRATFGARGAPAGQGAPAAQAHVDPLMPFMEGPWIEDEPPPCPDQPPQPVAEPERPGVERRPIQDPSHDEPKDAPEREVN